MSEQDLIWVDKEFANKFKEVKDDNKKAEILEEYLKSVQKTTRDEYRSSLEAMDEDAVMYQGLMLKTKKRFEELKNESLDAFYKMWEDYDAERGKIQKKVEDVSRLLEPLKNEINQINEALGKIRTWDFEKLLKTLRNVSALCEKDMVMLEFLMKNYVS